jgi:hypothetical protein
MSTVCTAKWTYIPDLDTRPPPVVFQRVSIATSGNLDVNRIAVGDDQKPEQGAQKENPRLNNHLRYNSTFEHRGVGSAEHD